MALEKPFVLNILDDMKEYYQMPARWNDDKKNYSISIGYCFDCKRLRDLTDVYYSETVSLQCCSSRHKNVLNFDSKKFDYFLKCLEFFDKNKWVFDAFDLKDASVLEKAISRKTLENKDKAYRFFDGLIALWESNEIKRMHNSDYIETKEFSQLVKDYEKWNSMSREDQIRDISSLHEISLKHQKIFGRYEKKISPMEEILD